MARPICLCKIDRCRLTRTCWPRPPLQLAGSLSSRTSSREPRRNTVERSDACTWQAHRCARLPKLSASATNASTRSSRTAAFVGGDDGAAKKPQPSGSVPSAVASNDRSASSLQGQACTSATPASWPPSVSTLPGDRRRIRCCSLSQRAASFSARSAEKHGCRCKPSCPRQLAKSTRHQPSAMNASGSAERSSPSNFARQQGSPTKAYASPRTADASLRTRSGSAITSISATLPPATVKAITT